MRFDKKKYSNFVVKYRAHQLQDGSYGSQPSTIWAGQLSAWHKLIAPIAPAALMCWSSAEANWT